MRKLLLILTFSFLFLSSLKANTAPITQANVFAFIDNEGASPVSTGQGINFSIGVVNVLPVSTSGTTAVALHLNTNDSINPLPNFSSQGNPGLFGQDIAYDVAVLNGYFTPWQITITNQTDDLILTTPDRTGAPIMSFVDGLSISGSTTEPIISWNSPSTGPSVDRIYYELWNDDTDQIIVFRTQISGASPESITLNEQELPQGVNIVSGTNYAIRITPENRDANGIATRSSNWLGWLAQDGQASGTVLELVAGSPAGVSQNVDTPNETFKIEFDYRFETTTGTFNVYINNNIVGPSFDASKEYSSTFSHAVIEIENSALLGLTSVPLLFQIDGQTGSKIIVDNISFPNLQNGNFEQGLTLWTTEGPGTVTLATAPSTGLNAALQAAISISAKSKEE